MLSTGDRGEVGAATSGFCRPWLTHARNCDGLRAIRGSGNWMRGTRDSASALYSRTAPGGTAMIRPLSIIGAPSSAGAYAPGPDLAPAAWRRHGLVEVLHRSGGTVVDRGDVPGFRWRPDLARANAMNLDAAVRVARDVAEMVATAMTADQNALVLGGDCSVEVGTVAGALRDEPSTGLIYVDLDVDLNPLADGEGAFSWMGVAHMLDIPGVASEMAAVGPRRPMLQPSDILLFAADNIMPGEARVIADRGIDLIDLKTVKRDPDAAVERAADWARRFKRILVHCDVDVLAFVDFPIAENTRRQAGLTFEELSVCLTRLMGLPNWRTLTVTQLDPNHAPDEAESFGQLNQMLALAVRGTP